MAGRITIVGRGARRTCPFCHERIDAAEASSPCPACEVELHDECWQEVAACPIRGCGSRVPRRGERERAAARRMAPLEAGEHPRATTRAAGRFESDERRAGPRPGLLARLGPYARLLTSAALHLVFFLGGLALLGGLFFAVIQDGSRALHSLGLAACLVPFLGLALLLPGAFWLPRVPGAFVAISSLLASDDPIRGRVTITTVVSGSGRSQTTTHHARLDLGDGHSYQFKLSEILRPWWLNDGLRGEEVWVYGYRDDRQPPWLLEFSDGWLALCYPDDTELQPTL
ncbi:MAG: hypothetical protein AB7N76_27565 [Planctomycetota bacterium]